jgi:serine protease Do
MGFLRVTVVPTIAARLASALFTSALASTLAWGLGTALAEPPAPMPLTPPKPLGGCEQEFMRVVEGVRPSVVSVISYSNLARHSGTGRGVAEALKKSVGSGVVMDAEGHVLTTTSVVGSSRNLFVRTHDGVERAAVFLGADFETGLVLLKAKPEGLAPAPLGRPGELQPGAWAIIVAESFGHFPRYAFGAFTQVAARSGQSENGRPLLEMSTQVYPGNSGGAVANANGEVVGLVLGAMSGDVAAAVPGDASESGSAEWSGNTGATSLAAGGVASDAAGPASGGVPMGPTVSLAIPIDRAGSVASDLARHGSSAPGYLGVRVRAPAPGLKDLLRFEDGVVILEVLAMSPAAAAGIEAGDVILSFGGQKVREPSELARLVAQVRPGERRDLEVLRGDVRLSRAVTITTVPMGEEVDRRAAEEERQRLKQRIESLKQELEQLESRLQAR